MLFAEKLGIDRCAETHLIEIEIIDFGTGAMHHNGTKLRVFRGASPVAAPILNKVLINGRFQREPTLARNRLDIGHFFAFEHLFVQVNHRFGNVTHFSYLRFNYDESHHLLLLQQLPFQNMIFLLKYFFYLIDTAFKKKFCTYLQRKRPPFFVHLCFQAVCAIENRVYRTAKKTI